MAISPETLRDLINDVRENRSATMHELARTQRRVEELREQLQDLTNEETAFRASLSRRFPDDPSALQLLEELEDNEENFNKRVGDVVFETTGDETWTRAGRSDAVYSAILNLWSSSREPVTPAEIENFLNGKGREDKRDEISSAIAYLNRKNRVSNVGRGQWIIIDPAPANPTLAELRPVP